MEFVQPIRDKKQIDSMKKILKATSTRDYVLFTLGINSGLRISDLLKLRVGDVVDDDGKIADRIQIREKKTGKEKNFPISDTSRKALKEYFKERQPESNEEALFPSRKGGTPICREHAYRIINTAARSIGIKDNIGTHTMRKTFGYHAYKSGLDISTIQKLLNHSSQAITLAYIGITQDQLDDVYLNLNL